MPKRRKTKDERPKTNDDSRPSSVVRRRRPSFLLTFSVVSFMLLVLLALALAFGIQYQLEQTGLSQETWTATDLVNSYIVPLFRPADLNAPILPGTLRYIEVDPEIKSIMQHNHIVRVKLWAKDGTLLYSDEPELIGQKFVVADDLQEAFSGQTHSDISNLTDDENKFERGKFDRLFEIYLPFRLAGSATPAAAFEVYHDLTQVDARNNEIRSFTWAVLGIGFLALYGSLFTLVRTASRTLTRRNRENEHLYQEVSRRLAERIKAEDALRFQVEFERLVMSISTNFINLAPGEVDNGIGHALGTIGSFAGADRSYVYQFSGMNWPKAKNWAVDSGQSASVHPLSMTCTHEWCGEGVAPLLRIMQDLPTRSFPWLYERLQKAEVVEIPDVAELPAEAAAEKVFFQSVSNKSIVLVPMLYNRSLVGFLGFDFVHTARVWSSETILLLKIVGEIFMNALERKRAEDALRESEERFRAVFESTALAIGLSDLEGHIVQSNKPFQDLVGYSGEELTKLRFADITYPGDNEKDVAYFKQLVDGEIPYYAMEKRCVKKDGTLVWVNLLVSLLRDARGNPRYSIAMVQDITESRRAQDEIRRQLERLAALRSIDNAITSSFDLHNTLGVILEQVVDQLKVDAADVLLFDRNPDGTRGSLEYAMGRGFRSELAALNRTFLYRGPAAYAAYHRKLVKLPDVRKLPEGAHAQLVEGEGFEAYYAVPLCAKDKVVGVLEIFHRSPIQPRAEWLDFLETLAGQTAIAVDNALLFQDLQRYNLELSLAYDTTLEGWSHALDLRDHETEGHTQRVAEMSVRLANLMGVDEATVVHLRRGALLHDIGMMGIPDSILLKPGPLTDEEWAIMKLHPVYAHELLSPIAFLHPALDIPYAHHEKWDGTGYPRGLKGEAIPHAARIFAVVDVYDALCSDRPYRSAWSEERTIEHIKALSGIHFDPTVVEAFLLMDRTPFQHTPTSPQLALGLFGRG
jgi:PAS domain S-box-containing protein